MSLLNWEAKYSMDISEVDRQHEGLVDLINEAHEIMKDGRTNEDMGAVFDKLILYAKEHFIFEEKFMAEAGHKHMQKHIEEHNYFAEQVTSFKDQFDHGRKIVSMKVLRFLMEWLVDHITGTDALYAEDFKKLGLK